MALQSSGEIKISQILTELDYASNRVNSELENSDDESGVSERNLCRWRLEALRIYVYIYIYTYMYTYTIYIYAYIYI